MTATDTNRLAELEARMATLVAARASALATAQAMIENANREFDEQAVSLGRQIKKLRGEAPTPTPAKKSSRPRIPTIDALPDDWDQDEKKHYLELLKKGQH